MKFEEKLVRLRKEHALSQEELAEKLDVTRQTVSKWELGQSKPDMEKLVKISTVFNVSIESLTDDSQTVNTEGKKMEKPIVKILIVIGIILLIFFIVKLTLSASLVSDFFKQFGPSTNATDIINGAQDIINNVSENILDQTSENTNEVMDIYEEVTETITDKQEEIENNIQDVQEEHDQIQRQFNDVFNQVQQMQQNMLTQ